MTGCDSSGTGGRVYVGNNGLHSIGIGGGFHRNTQLRIPPQYHHPFRSKPCQRFRTKPATRSTRNPTARSNPKSATHSKTNPPRRRVDVEGLRTSGRGQFPTALFAHRLAFEFQPMRSADQAIKDRVSYRRIAAAQIVMPAINR